MRAKLPILGVLLLIAIGAGLVLWSLHMPYREASSIGRDAPTFEVLSQRFEDIARNKGGVYAFELLKRATLPPNTDTHLLGHVIGDVFYTQVGIDGIAQCSQDFRNACSHTIVIGALNDFGASSSTIAMIDDACKRAPGGSGAYTMCYHGLGHGVFAFFGYDLSKAVSFCKRMGTDAYQNEQYAQCVGGAIMELFGGGGHDREAWDHARSVYLTEDPLAPCDTAIVPSRAKRYCYLYLTPRLMESVGIDIGFPDPSLFSEAMSFCAALPKESVDRDACFGGFGKDFVGIAANRDIRAIDMLPDQTYALAARWCEDALVHDGVESCMRQALESVFWGGENNPRASFRFCTSAPSPLIDQCFSFLAGMIEHYLSADTRSYWCEQLDVRYRSACEA
jgi:hypothetical protein